VPVRSRPQHQKRTWITLLAVLALSFVFAIMYRKRTGCTLKTEPRCSP